jgi:tetratricopeptide (TPR) repeat protein
LFYSFQRSARTEQSSPASFAASIIHQLCTKLKPEIMVDAIAELEKLKTRFPQGPLNCRFDTIWAIVEQLLMSDPGHTLVIDALDEGIFKDSPSASEFLDYIFKTAQKTRSKVLVLSQHDPQFATVVPFCSVIEMSNDILSFDIMLFAEQEYNRLGLRKEEKETVLEHVRSSCNGSFRYTELSLGYLKSWPSKEDIKCRLERLPSSLDKFYELALVDRSLKEEDKQLQNTILAITLLAQRTLKLSEIANATSLSFDGDVQDFGHCKQLISTQDDSVQFSHPSVRVFLESFGILRSTNFSHSVLAEKCLATLLKLEYADLERIKLYLRANNGEQSSVSTTSLRPTDAFYEYASRYWHVHLSLVTSPSVELLQQTNAFIDSYQFAYWSQYAQRNFGLGVGVTKPLRQLKSWYSQLPPILRNLVGYDKCPISAYNKLSAAYGADEQNVVYKWLAQLSLSQYGLALGLSAEVSDPEETAAKLLKLFGPTHPFVLRARWTVAYARLITGRMRAALRIYSEMLEIRRQLFGEDDVRSIEALHYVGESEYYMTHFTVANETFQCTVKGFLVKSGPDSWSYLAAQRWLASSWAYLNKLEDSLLILEKIFCKRRNEVGTTDELALQFQIGMADVQRALGRTDDAICNLEEALETRRGSYSTSDTSRLDVEILLARTYQEAGQIQNATAAIQKLEKNETLPAHFERLCQVTHIKGLILASDKYMDNAINCLLDILIQAEDDQNNRALLWIRLDLAALLRERNDDGDSDLASSIFGSLVKDVSGDFEPGFPEEPDPPRLLEAAEKALKFVQAQKYNDAQAVLDSENLDWRRPSDFWLWVSDIILL